MWRLRQALLTNRSRQNPSNRTISPRTSGQSDLFGGLGILAMPVWMRYLGVVEAKGPSLKHRPPGGRVRRYWMGKRSVQPFSHGPPETSKGTEWDPGPVSTNQIAQTFVRTLGEQNLSFPQGNKFTLSNRAAAVCLFWGEVGTASSAPCRWGEELNPVCDPDTAPGSVEASQAGRTDTSLCR